MIIDDELKFERTMKLSSVAGCSVEDAKAALEACGYDMLDSMVYLEKLGKATEPTTASYSTDFSLEDDKVRKSELRTEYRRQNKVTFKSVMGNFFKWVGKVIKAGNEHFLDIHTTNDVTHIPLTVVVIVALIGWYLVVVPFVISLFFGVTYTLSGKSFKEDDAINKGMKKASDVAESIKREFKDDTCACKEDVNEHVDTMNMDDFNK